MRRTGATILSICEPYPRPLMALSQLYGDVGFVKNPRRLYPCGARFHPYSANSNIFSPKKPIKIWSLFLSFTVYDKVKELKDKD